MIIDKKRIGDFLKFIQFNPFPIEGQRSKGEGKDLFVEDWLTIEFAKFFYIGKDSYLSDPSPLRFRNNNSFNQKEIVEWAEQKYVLFSGLEEKMDKITIFYVGRGFDLLLALMQKDWKEIRCYDSDPRYGPLLLQFFKEPNIYFFCNDEVTIPFEDMANTYVIESSYF
jgi:hypothetical protein